MLCLRHVNLVLIFLVAKKNKPFYPKSAKYQLNVHTTSHHKILSTDVKVRTTHNVYIIDSGKHGQGY